MIGRQMTHLDLQSGRALGTFVQRPTSAYLRGGKRCLDLVLSLLLLPLILPLLLILLGLNFCIGGALLFGHVRLGKAGRPFVCWKIQTMLPNSETILRRHLSGNPQAAQEWQATQKLKNDPRVTKFGRFLRRSSLDELPQIWNVLRGDMSLVGPRPITDQELHHYGPTAHHYLNTRPGITGIWQVQGRSNGCFRERVQMDHEYCQQISIAKDLGLIAATSLVILKGTGR